MRAERTQESPDADKRGPRRGSGVRPRRAAADGPIGFGTIMRDVSGRTSTGSTLPSTVTNAKSSASTPSAAPARENAGTSANLAASGDIGNAAAGNAAPLFSPNNWTTATVEGLAAHALHGESATADVNANAGLSAGDTEPALPTRLGRMSPSMLLTAVLDEATKQAITEASKELHVELEPMHLGPLVVRLRRNGDGRLDIDFRARQKDAARILDSGSDLLRSRLEEAGFMGSRIRVLHDESVSI